MDMSSMASMTATASTASASSTSMPSMDMGTGSCKISMLWNWYTVDSCFLSSSWHVRSSATFAGTCIGVILLVMSLELLRRGQREFDRYLHKANAVHMAYSSEEDNTSNKGLANQGFTTVSDRLKLWQHVIRSLLYMVQFAVGYFVMLLAMYFNGYIIICIIIGAFLGSLVFQRDTYAVESGPETKDSCCC